MFAVVAAEPFVSQACLPTHSNASTHESQLSSSTYWVYPFLFAFYDVCKTAINIWSTSGESEVEEENSDNLCRRKIEEKGATSCKRNEAHSINAFNVHFPSQHLIKYLNFVFILNFFPSSSFYRESVIKQRKPVRITRAQKTERNLEGGEDEKGQAKN